MEKKPDYMRGQEIYESLEGVPKEERDVLVLDQLAVLYPEKGEQMFIWWLQARNAGLVDDK